ncbi:MAG: hypothetical protein BWY56_00609 [Acidobacteria bacterium ADurb.Bin340]|nr:MAG: hypothetical protein BWY56_00609 [Acidobacteria bacterium ADurb.Bin340]
MLERLKVAVRARAPFEALDLGLAVLRAQAGPVYRVWLTTFLPVALVLHTLLWRHPWWATLLLVWLKPLLGRPILHILGRATFGEVPSLRATLRAFPLIYRRGTLATLLWRRLGPERSLLLPVWQLEGQQGRDYRQRSRVLLRAGRSAAFLWTFFAFGMWLLLPASLLALAAFLWPQGSGFDLMEALFASEAHRRLPALDFSLALLPTLATALLEPFYVAGGFGLYLNRRVHLEGWDLELAFRGLAARATRMRSVVLALLLVLGLPLVGSPPPPSAAKSQLQEVLKSPEFQVKSKRRALRFRHRPEARQPRTWQPPAWLAQLLPWIAQGVKVLLVSVGLGLLVWLLLRFRRDPGAPPEVREERRPPEQLFGLDLRPRSLPKRPGSAAEALWDAGRFREALALLYRGALAHLVRVEHATIPPGATESEVLGIAQQALPEGAGAYLERLTGAWCRVAYGGAAPEASDRHLCGEWSLHFPGGRS